MDGQKHAVLSKLTDFTTQNHYRKDEHDKYIHILSIFLHTRKKFVFYVEKIYCIYKYSQNDYISNKISIWKCYKSERTPNPGPFGSSVKLVKPLFGSEAKRPFLKRQHWNLVNDVSSSFSCD